MSEARLAVASAPPSTLYFTVGVYEVTAVTLTSVIVAPLDGVKVIEQPFPFDA